VKSVYQCHAIFRETVPSGRGKIRCALIAPGTVKRVFHNGEKFYMGKAKILNVRDKLFCHLSIGEIPSLGTFPGPKVYFVDTHGVANAIFLPPRTHPLLIFPGIERIPHHRSSSWRNLCPPRKRVRLFLNVVSPLDHIFV
jgi:hypothetical protein